MFFLIKLRDRVLNALSPSMRLKIVKLKSKVIQALYKINFYKMNLDDASYNPLHRTVFFFLAADYPNLGDIAITYAQKKLISDNFPKDNIITIPLQKTEIGIVSVKKLIRKNDIIILVGGGNIGNLYPGIEGLRVKIINGFKDYKIISFPQSLAMDFTDVRYLRRLASVYESHPSLVLFARDSVSLSQMKDYFPKVKSYLCPDIVLSLCDTYNSSIFRDGIIMCLRNDVEGSITPCLKEKISSLLVEYNKDKTIDYLDTHLGDNSVSGCFENDFYNLLQKFSSAELIVTDRLHGLIFAILTKTPCLFLDNTTHKLSALYNTWLTELKHIRMFEGLEQLQSILESDFLEATITNRVQSFNINDKFKVLLNTLQ